MKQRRRGRWIIVKRRKRVCLRCNLAIILHVHKRKKDRHGRVI